MKASTTLTLLEDIDYKLIQEALQREKEYVKQQRLKNFKIFKKNINK